MICFKECEASPDALPAPCGSATMLKSMLLQSADRSLFIYQRGFDLQINGIDIRVIRAMHQIRFLSCQSRKSAKNGRNSVPATACGVRKSQDLRLVSSALLSLCGEPHKREG